VFRHFEKFSSINPVVKAPTFITMTMLVLMDSGLILQHIALCRVGQSDAGGSHRA
jgi:glutathione S-transferase